MFHLTQRLRLLAVLGMALVIPAASHAQSAIPPPIHGPVMGATGGALPGGTVRWRGPALQLPQLIMVVATDGPYRFVELPAGTYDLTFELSGFSTLARS